MLHLRVNDKMTQSYLTKKRAFSCHAVTCFGAVLLWCATTGAVWAQTLVPARVSWVTYSSESMAALDLPSSQVRLVLFRAVDDLSSEQPAGVFINGRLLSSLLPGGFVDAVVCRDSWRMEARTTDGVSSPVQRRGTEPELFVRVAVRQGVPHLQPISAPEFVAQADGLRRQAHVVSRLPPVGDCSRGETRYTLASELLFQFGKDGIGNLLKLGEFEIVKLARKIREDHASIDMVEVVGHSDPMGTRALNLELSTSRAQTVAQVMLGVGLPADKLKAVGMADDQLVVPGCDAKKLPRAELLACNQPNRRVEVVVRGTRRAPQ
jgi:OOP family OmpA-OmpF porin